MDEATAAYQVGDLEKLIDLMTEAQQSDFKYAIVRQAVHYAEENLPPEEEDEGERGAISMAQRWLDEPTDERQQEARLFIAAEDIDGGLRYADYARSFAEPAEAVSSWEGTSGMVAAARHARSAANLDQVDAAMQWQVEAAFAILQGTDLPSLEES